MADIYVDTLDAQATYSIDTERRQKMTRRFIVYNLDTTSSTMLTDALQQAGIPRIGDISAAQALSGIYLKCTSLKSGFIDSDKVEVEATFESNVLAGDITDPLDDKPQWEVGSTVTESETQFRADGTPLLISYTEPGFSGPPPQRTYIATVSKKIPHVYVRARRTETSSPLAVAAKYVGKINSSDIEAFPARTLLCTAITGNSTDGGETWQVTYEFEKAEHTWDLDLFYVDPETQQVPGDVNTADRPGGVRYAVPIYEAIDFSALNL